MSGFKKYRWLILVFVWAGSLGLTYMNSQALQKISSQRSEIEALRMDKEFWQRNSENVAKVINLQKSMYQDIESLNLAQVALINKLSDFISSTGLSDVRVEPDIKNSEETVSTIRISFKGNVKDGMDVLTHIQKNFSFLSFQKVNMSPEGNAGMVKFDTSVKYQYRFVTGSIDQAMAQ